MDSYIYCQNNSGWLFAAILRDVTERIIHEKGEDRNRKRLRAVIDTSGDGALTINSSGKRMLQKKSERIKKYFKHPLIQYVT
ncbi:hypothetical protein [Desulfopila aestuarii]|uniref:hypothetical protein n=1 Tax=Desulfopila aestuarii TaxID=231440 RepID=UPI000935A661|nr:hypothetical protein [Desulfopila aestuarii]